MGRKPRLCRTRPYLLCYIAAVGAASLLNQVIDRVLH